jgi:hypothetical protein
MAMIKEPTKGHVSFLNQKHMFHVLCIQLQLHMFEETNVKKSLI